MKPSARALLLEIARCPHFNGCIDDPGAEHPCRAIAASQGVTDGHHLPEPWSGHIDGAPILFLSSNPSIWLEEEYPHRDWPDDLVEDFFANRFGEGRKEWVAGYLHTLLSTGEHARQHVGFWASIRQRAGELLQREATPGVDFAISEVVHCKSEREVGVWEALDSCVDRYLKRVVEASAARTIVVLGRVAEGAVRTTFEVPASVRLYRASVSGRNRSFAFLPHPNSRGYRTFPKCFSPAELAQLQRELHGA